MTRDELRQIPVMQRALNRKIERLEILREQATSVPAVDTSKDKVQTSTENRSMAIVDTFVDLDTEIHDDFDDLDRQRLKAAALIDSADITSEEKKIMSLRYVNGLYWRDVAFIMNYSQAYIQRWHSVILEKLFS